MSLSPHIVPSRDCDPRLLATFSLRRESQLKPLGYLVVDSEKVVRRALQCGVQPVAILLTEAHLVRLGELLQGLSCDLILAGEREMAEIVGHRIHQGVMMLAHRPVKTSGPLPERLVVLNRVSDAQNVGAIVRSAHAFGFGAILYDEFSCSPYTRRSIRVSMGSVFKLDICAVSGLNAHLAKLKQEGYQLVAAGLWQKAVPLREIPPCAKLGLVIGNEDSGAEAEIVALCDERAYIPMTPGIDSLNAAAAAAIALYELGRPGN